MKFRMITSFSIVVIITILICSCSCPDLDVKPQVTLCERVFMNESHRFTFLTDGRLKEVRVNNFPADVKIVYDILPGESMFYSYQQYCSGGTTMTKWLEIHVRSVNDINGGSWNHGKFGKGQTNVIQ